MKAWQKLRRKIVKSRNYKSIDICTFTQDVTIHLVDNIAPISPPDMQNIVEEYDRILLKIMDKHAPLKEKVVDVRTRSPWMTTEIMEEKKRKRKYERKWFFYSLWRIEKVFKAQKKKYDKLLKEAHTKYLSDLISDNSNDPKSLFKLIDSIVSNGKRIFYLVMNLKLN